jgi:hypothetical protein
LRYRALHVFKESARLSVRELAFDCLLNHLASCNGINTEIVDSGGVPLLLSYIRDNLDQLQHDSNVCASCEMIWKLASRVEKLPELLKHGALDLIASLMRAHRTDETMIRYGCLAIGLIEGSGEQGLRAVRGHGGLTVCGKRKRITVAALMS